MSDLLEVRQAASLHWVRRSRLSVLDLGATFGSSECRLWALRLRVYKV